MQIGRVYRQGVGDHAFVWSGSAASGVDLHTLLPLTWQDSVATSIDELGNIVGTAHDNTGALRAVMWVPTPEPTTLLLLIGLIGCGRSGRRSPG
jgi:hypothetical protein